MRGGMSFDFFHFRLSFFLLNVFWRRRNICRARLEVYWREKRVVESYVCRGRSDHVWVSNHSSQWAESVRLLPSNNTAYPWRWLNLLQQSWEVNEKPVASYLLEGVMEMVPQSRVEDQHQEGCSGSRWRSRFGPNLENTFGSLSVSPIYGINAQIQL